jgi:DNA-binding GntR family transcriptional regulator
MEVGVAASIQATVEAPDYRGLAEWVTIKVIDGIRKGSFVPGERLLEEDLARRFGVSRAPVRDAIHRLESLGVIERRHPRGVYVTHWTPDDRAEVLAIADALILASIQLALARLTKADFSALDEIVASVQRAADAGLPVSDLSTKDARFHRIIAVASGNRRLVEMLDTLQLPLGLYANSAEYYSPDEWLTMHAGLLESLKGGDEDAAIARFWKNRRDTIHILFGASTD